MLSALNFQNLRHDFSDTINPMCPINDGVEDTKHFDQLQRNNLLNPLQATLLSYGLSNLSNEEIVSIIFYGDKRLPIE